MSVFKIFLGLFILLGILVSPNANAQNLMVGHTTVTFNDPSRTGGFGSGAGLGRQIQTEVYYPAATAGEDVMVATGTWPLIVFGHGFAMNWDAYSNIWEQLVPLGYIMAFPRTESTLFPAPSHNDFGLDIAIVADKLTENGQNSSSLFYQKLTDYICVMGHSMGGGAAVLAASQSTLFDAYVGLAPAETSPSAISAAAALQIPSIILSGSNDGVTPPSQNHLPIFEAIPHACKSFANLIGGGHCYFANSNFNCDFGEATVSSGISINRAQQQNLTYQQLTPWLAYFLDRSCTGYEAFISYPIPGIDLTTTCPTTLPNVTISLNGLLLSTDTPGLSYQWYLDGSPIPGETNDTLVIPTNFSGTYNFNLLVNFEYGCQFSNTIADLTELELNYQLYPIPAHDYLELIGDFETSSNYLLQNMQGQVIQAGSLDTKHAQINVSSVKTGCYLLQIRAKHNATFKVLIQH